MNEDNKDKIFWLDDPQMWRNIRGGALGLVLLVSPLIYFGIINNLDMNKFLSYDLGWLIVFMTLMNILSVFEARNRGFEDELDFDNSIIEMEIEIDDNAKKIRPNITKGIPILSTHNKELQKSYNKQKTNLIIEKKQVKIDNLKIKLEYTRFRTKKKRYNRKLSKLTNKIAKLKKIPKRDRRFKPYRFDRLLTAGDVSKYKRIGDKEVKSNPKKIPIIGAIIKMPIKGFGMSLGGMFLMLFIVDDKAELARFYLWFIVIIGFTIISQYIITRYKTKVQYKNSLTIKIQLQEVVINGIEKDDIEDKQTKEKVCDICGSKLEDYKNVMLICSNKSCIKRAIAIQEYEDNAPRKEVKE